MTDQWSLERRCECPNGGRKPPLRIYAETARLLAELIGENVRDIADHVLSSYRCHRCGATIELTVGDYLRGPAA